MYNVRIVNAIAVSFNCIEGIRRVTCEIVRQPMFLKVLAIIKVIYVLGSVVIM